MKIESKAKTLLHDILNHCFKLCEAGYAPFYHISGHVNWIDVHVCRSKEDYNSRIYEATPVGRVGVLLDDVEDLERVKSELSQLRKELNA